MRPVYGQGFFHVCLDGVIWYTIVFEYDDPEREYARLLSIGGLALEEELEGLRSRMQEFIDSEEVYINGKPVRPLVTDAWIELRGDPRRSSVVFRVKMEFTPDPSGRLVYEDYYEEEKAEYDYSVHWIIPECASVVSYEMPGEVRVSRGLLQVYVRRGTRIPGYESIVLDTSNCGTR